MIYLNDNGFIESGKKRPNGTHEIGVSDFGRASASSFYTISICIKIKDSLENDFNYFNLNLNEDEDEIEEAEEAKTEEAEAKPEEPNVEEPAKKTATEESSQEREITSDTSQPDKLKKENAPAEETGVDESEEIK